MKALLFVALVVSPLLIAAAPLTEDQYQFLFTRFVDQYNKQYEVDQFFARYNTFKNNLNFILAHNIKNESYTLAMNEFGDMTSEEFAAKMTGVRVPRNFRSGNTADVATFDFVAPNAEVDWRAKGKVTPVKNQGQCGSCWAFSATGAIETAWAIAKNKLIDLSEQQLVDCSGTAGNHGCNGGWMHYAFNWVIKNGQCDTASYPYKARDMACQKTCKPAVTLSSYKDVPPNNENALLQAVNGGAVSIAIQADQMAFQFYSGGVFDAACGTNLNHGVLVVGYGTDGGKDYWHVKNSWGSSWGEKGYIRMIRNKNQCGLAKLPNYPVV